MATHIAVIVHLRGKLSCAARHMARQAQQFVVLQYPATRQIARLGSGFAPGRKRHSARLGIGRQIGQTPQTLPGAIRWLAIVVDREQDTTLFLQPGTALEVRELVQQQGRDRREMQHIGRRVVKLRGCQRALTPIGTGLGFVERDPQQLLDQIGIADVIGEAGQSGGDLGIEHGGRQTSVYLVEDLEILASGMQLLDCAAVRQDVHQRREGLDCKWVDAGQHTGCRYLHQAQLRVEAAAAFEFGVQCQPGCIAQFGAQRG